MIKMEMPNREECSFPKEKWKTLFGKHTSPYNAEALHFRMKLICVCFLCFLAFLIFAANMTLATVSLSVVHDRVPDRNPLPDVFLDNIPSRDWALNISEILIMVQIQSCIILITFHKHR